MVYYWETQLFRGHWSPGDFWDPSRCRCWGCCWKLKLLTAAPWLTTVRWKMPATWIRWVFVKWRVFVKGLKQEESEMQPPSRLTICWLVYMGLYMFIYVYCCCMLSRTSQDTSTDMYGSQWLARFNCCVILQRWCCSWWHRSTERNEDLTECYLYGISWCFRFCWNTYRAIWSIRIYSNWLSRDFRAVGTSGS